MDLGIDPLVQKRFDFPEGSVELYAEKVAARDLCPSVQAVSASHITRRPCCAEGLLWCAVVHHEDWGQRL